MTTAVKTRQFEGKRIALIGIGRTGLAAAPVLSHHGAKVVIADTAQEAELGARLGAARALDVELFLGKTALSALDGADIVVPSPGVPRDAPILRDAVRRGMRICSEIEIAYLLAEAPILAVTGTNGKTTTAILLGEMLRADGRKTFVAGNVSADDVKLPLITAAHEAQADEPIVAEVSSFQLEWVHEFRPKVGILTNITPDHLNRHHDVSEYVGCKARLFAAQRPDDVAVVNAVNRYAREIGQDLVSRRIWFDRQHCRPTDSACVRGGQIVVRWDDREIPICRADELQIPGTHNLENALAASAAAIAFGAEPDAVAEALRKFEGVVHRMEPVRRIGGVLYINNSMCTNVDAAVRSLDAVGGPVVVIAGGVSKNSDFAPLGAALARGARHLVVLGRAADEIAEAAREAGLTSISHADSLEEAVTRATAVALPGDAVMLSPACASFDMFQDFEQRGEAFRQIVRSIPNV